MMIYDPKKQLETGRDELHAMLLDLEVVYEHEAGVFKLQGYPRTLSELADRLQLLAPKGTFLARTNGARVALQDYLDQLRLEQETKIRLQLNAYAPSAGLDVVKKFLAAIQDKAETELSELDISAVLSMLWQIKRKVNGHYKVPHPLMLIFAGGQGYGKTWLLQKLFGTVSGIQSGTMQLKDFNNAFNIVTFSKYYIIPFQEMNAKVQYDEQLLKTLVTEDSFQYRDPHTPHTHKLVNKATLYGTSNFPVAQSIPDDTGARRWWEITSPNRQFNERDQVRVGAIPFADIWLAVDGTSAQNPRTGVLDQMGIKQQTEFRHKKDIEVAFEELIVQEPDVTLVTSYMDSEVYEAFSTWFTEQGLKKPRKGDVRTLLKMKGMLKVTGANVLIYRGFRLRGKLG